MTSKFQISAKFGHKEIFSGDVNNFFGGGNTTKVEWTENSIYRNARNCEITTTFGNSQKKPNLVKSSQFDVASFFPQVDERSTADYLDKKEAFTSQIMRKKDIIQSKKSDFLYNNLNINNKSDEKENIIRGIKEKFLDLVKTDENLRKKLKVNNNLSNLPVPNTTTNLNPNLSNMNVNSSYGVNLGNTVNPNVQFNQQQNNYNPYQNTNNSMYQQQPGFYGYNNQGSGFGSYNYK